MRRQRQGRCHTLFEPLEPRQMLSVVTVTPQNFTAVINSTNVGDTFNFAPGTYTLTANSDGAAASWPQGTYVGNGAVIGEAGGIDGAGNPLIQFAGGSDVSGFTFTDAPILCQDGAFNIHGNTFSNEQLGIMVVDDTNSQYVNNTFTGGGGGGIYGYPGSNNTYSNNTFDNVSEPIHLASATCANITVSNNTITRAQRYAIEIQLAATNLTVSNNIISQWLANGNQGAETARTGISIASSGTGISVTNNQIIQNLAPGTPYYVNTGAGLEIMGDNNVTVTGNTFYGWNGPYLTGVRAGATFTIASNTIYGLDNNGGDPMGYALAPIVNPTDRVSPLSAFTSISERVSASESIASTAVKATAKVKKPVQKRIKKRAVIRNTVRTIHSTLLPKT
jgi:parallel beta-helix repeat protein